MISKQIRYVCFEIFPEERLVLEDAFNAYKLNF